MNGMSPTRCARASAARDGAAVVANLVERDRDRVGEPLDDHAERVADEDHVDAGLVDEARHREVVGRDHRDLRAGALACAELGDGDLRRPEGARLPRTLCSMVAASSGSAAFLRAGLSAEHCGCDKVWL